MNTLTPESLFDYANAYARAAEDQGHGTKYPTLREAARKFRVRQGAIEETCESYCGPHYMGLVVGIRTGAGVGSYKGGDRQVEAYKEGGPMVAPLNRPKGADGVAP